MPANHLAPPIDLTKIFGGVATWAETGVRQNRHGVYNPLGRKIGSYVSLADLCQGRWIAFAGETKPPYADLRIRDFWGNLTPAPARCLELRQPTTIATPRQVEEQRQKVEREDDPLFQPPNVGAVFGNLTTTQIALWGSAGLLAIALLRRRA